MLEKRAYWGKKADFLWGEAKKQTQIKQKYVYCFYS